MFNFCFLFFYGVQDGKFYLSDRRSSNGTMVYLQDPFPLTPGQGLKLRMGRTTLSLQAKRNWTTTVREMFGTLPDPAQDPYSPAPEDVQEILSTCIVAANMPDTSAMYGGGSGGAGNGSAIDLAGITAGVGGANMNGNANGFSLDKDDRSMSSGGAGALGIAGVGEGFNVGSHMMPLTGGAPFGLQQQFAYNMQRAAGGAGGTGEAGEAWAQRQHYHSSRATYELERTYNGREGEEEEGGGGGDGDRDRNIGDSAAGRLGQDSADASLAASTNTNNTRCQSQDPHSGSSYPNANRGGSLYFDGPAHFSPLKDHSSPDHNPHCSGAEDYSSGTMVGGRSFHSTLSNPRFGPPTSSTGSNAASPTATYERRTIAGNAAATADSPVLLDTGIAGTSRGSGSSPFSPAANRSTGSTAAVAVAAPGSSSSPYAATAARIPCQSRLPSGVHSPAAAAAVPVVSTAPVIVSSGTRNQRPHPPQQQQQNQQGPWSMGYYGNDDVGDAIAADLQLEADMNAAIALSLAESERVARERASQCRENGPGSAANRPSSSSSNSGGGGNSISRSRPGSALRTNQEGAAEVSNGKLPANEEHQVLPGNGKFTSRPSSASEGVVVRQSSVSSPSSSALLVPEGSVAVRSVPRSSSKNQMYDEFGVSKVCAAAVQNVCLLFCRFKFSFFFPFFFNI
jgi:hypothetical protein